MVAVGDSANLAQEVHIVDAAGFVLLEEAHEAFEFYRGQLCDDLAEHVEQGLRRNEADVCVVSLLHQLDDLVLLVRVNLSVDRLEYTVTEVHSGEGLTCKVPDQVTDWDHAIIVLKRSVYCLYLHVTY